MDAAVLDKRAADGFDPVYGARPLRREVERQLENPLAMRIVTGECPDGGRMRMEVQGQGIVLQVGREGRPRPILWSLAGLSRCGCSGLP